MQIEGKHYLEAYAIDLEKATNSAAKHTWDRFAPQWSSKTATAFRRAARLLRKRLEEGVEEDG